MKKLGMFLSTTLGCDTGPDRLQRCRWQLRCPDGDGASAHAHAPDRDRCTRTAGDG